MKLNQNLLPQLRKNQVNQWMTVKMMSMIPSLMTGMWSGTGMKMACGGQCVAGFGHLLMAIPGGAGEGDDALDLFFAL